MGARERARERLKELMRDYLRRRYRPLLITLRLSRAPRFRFIPLDSRLARAQRLRVAEELGVPVEEVRPYTYRTRRGSLKVLPLPIRHVHLGDYKLFSYSYPVSYANGSLLIPLEGRLVKVDLSSWKVLGDLGPIWEHQIGNRVTLTRPGDPLTGRSERSGPYKSFRNVYLSPLSNEIAFLAHGIRDEVEILVQYMFVDVDASLLSWNVDVVEGFEPLFIRLGGREVSIRHIPVDAVELEPRFDPGIVVRPLNFPYDRRGVLCYDAWTVFEPR